MANAANKNTTKTKIGISEIIGIFLSLLSLYVAVTQLINGNILNFLVALVAGLVINPLGWKQVEVKLPFNLSLPLRIIIWIVLMTITVYFI